MTNEPSRDGDHEIESLEFAGPEEVPFPPVLRLTSIPHDEHHEGTLDRAERWEAGETVPHVKNFSDPTRLRKLLTTRRVELIRSIMDSQPESIKQLAERLDRGTRQVHDDVHLLEEFGIVHLEDGKGRARKPTIPYDRIEIDVGIEAPVADDSDRALASG